MLSAIVYGRNDGYSYELNRRTALGLNQLALQLAPGRDEIIFVDYNTDNDLPTHPEAIVDTLTDRAKALTRVIRVRPDIHAALTTPGPPVREAICRNIALRRLRPETRWVLSTNPDCLLIAADHRPLSKLIETLPDAAYGLPRFELPRFVWESLPRSCPEETAKSVLTIAASLQLAESVRHYLPEIGYDAPGDFQLIPRDTLEDIAGFDESMSQGWHVDSNMNARLAQRFGPLSDVNDAASGVLKLFHAEHARRFSAKHGADRDEDAFDDYVNSDLALVPPTQADTWGRPGMEFEEFPLSAPPAQRVLKALIAGADQKPQNIPKITYGPDSFDRLPRNSAHLAGFLIDHLVYMSPTAKIGWFGEDDTAIKALADSAGLPNPVMTCTVVDQVKTTVEQADIIILDAPANADQGIVVQHAFSALLVDEWQRTAIGQPPRRVIGTNTPHSLFEAPFLTFIEGALTPVTTRIRYGDVKPRPWQRLNLMDHIVPGEAGLTTDRGIEAKPDSEGYIALCRLPHFPPGAYKLEYNVDQGVNWAGRAVLDVALDGREAVALALPTKAPGKRSGVLRFVSGADGLFSGGFEFRVHANGKAKIRLTSATLTLEDD